MHISNSTPDSQSEANSTGELDASVPSNVLFGEVGPITVPRTLWVGI